MKFFVGFVVLSFLATAWSFNEDAEIIPSDRDSNTRNDGDESVFVVIRPRPVFTDLDPFHRIFTRVFGRGSFPYPSVFPSRPDTGIFRDTVPEDGSTDYDLSPNPIFTDFSFDFPSPNFDSLPDNYDNTTHEVKVINGTKIEVNSTVTKNKNENGVFVQEVHIVRYSPEKPANETEVPNETEIDKNNETTNSTSTSKDANPSDNEVTNNEKGGEDFGSN